MTSKEEKEYIFNQDNNAAEIITSYIVYMISKGNDPFQYDIPLDVLFIVKIVDELTRLGYNVSRPIVGPHTNRITVEK